MEKPTRPSSPAGQGGSGPPYRPFPDWRGLSSWRVLPPASALYPHVGEGECTHRNTQTVYTCSHVCHGWGGRCGDAPRLCGFRRRSQRRAWGCSILCYPLGRIHSDKGRERQAGKRSKTFYFFSHKFNPLTVSGRTNPSRLYLFCGSGATGSPQTRHDPRLLREAHGRQTSLGASCDSDPCRRSYVTVCSGCPHMGRI